MGWGKSWWEQVLNKGHGRAVAEGPGELGFFERSRIPPVARVWEQGSVDTAGVITQGLGFYPEGDGGYGRFPHRAGQGAMA